MRSLLVVALAAFGLFVAQADSASAQNAQGRPGIVAVLDLTKVFKEHPGHKAKMDQLEKKFANLKQKFQTEQDTLKAEAQNATKNFKGERLNQIEVNLASKNSQIATQARQAQVNLMKEEAKIYYETYNEVFAIVQGLCRQHNITLVLRYDSTPLDPSKPRTVIRGVQRSVVFSSADLTDLVIKAVQKPTSTAMRPNN